MSAHLYFHLPSGRASWSIGNKGVITKKNLMNHFLNNPLYHSCEQIHISTWSLCPIRHIASVLLVNFASNSLLCLNLHSHYFHIKNITWITVTLQLPHQNYFSQNIQPLKNLSGFPCHVNTFPSKGFSAVLHN